MRRLTLFGGIVWCVVVARRLAGPRRPAAPRFDPVVVGTIEADGWRAYYERDFVTGFRLLLRLMREQFALGLLDTVRASHAAIRAQRAFAPRVNDQAATLHWLTRFYTLSPRREGVEASELACAELDYWIVHRRIVAAADKTLLVDALARLHALLFGGSEVKMRQSAEQRTLACNAVDRITSRTSTNPDQDWRLVRTHLIAAYECAVAASPKSASA